VYYVLCVSVSPSVTTELPEASADSTGFGVYGHLGVRV